MMEPIKLRYKIAFLVFQISASLLLIGLVCYAHYKIANLYAEVNAVAPGWTLAELSRLSLGFIWLVIGLLSWRYNAVIELDEDQLLITNFPGLNKRYNMEGASIEIKNNSIYYNKAKVFTAYFFHNKKDFNLICSYLIKQNETINLKRHLIDDDE